MNVHGSFSGSISTLANAYETITVFQTKLEESLTLPHRLCLVLRATSLLGADYRLPPRQYHAEPCTRQLYVALRDCEKVRPTQMY
jgi:hypothetical protein